MAYVVISSDRGLAGGYNSSVIRACEREVQARQAEGTDYALITVGRKAQGYFAYRSYDIAHSFEGISDSPTYPTPRRWARS